jgi:hypothetical protein
MKYRSIEQIFKHTSVFVGVPTEVDDSLCLDSSLTFGFSG